MKKIEKSPLPSFVPWAGFVILGGLLVLGVSLFDRYRFDSNLQAQLIGDETEAAPVDTAITNANCENKVVDSLTLNWCQDKPNLLQIQSQGMGFLVIVQGEGEEAGVKQFTQKETPFEVSVPLYILDKFILSASKYEVRLDCLESQECRVKWGE